ncbi:MAG: tyrosine-type recombinase/integrase [Acidobacteria bacterium]|nr:tyrosine-type recombinase/integrase [Acidobacteriota bacterium]
MKTLQNALDDYLRMRRSLGFKLVKEGVRLPKFLAFMQERKACCITTALALDWALQSRGPRGPLHRLAIVRGFAKYVAALDPRTEIPPASLLPWRYLRPRPYLYSEDEIRRLLEAAATWSRRERPHGRYYCLFGLLAVSGLRVGEAINLEVQDVDLNKEILTIRESKFGKSRFVPLHPTTARELAKYKERRDEFLGGRSSPYFFVSRNGTKLFNSDVNRVFTLVSVKAGLRSSTSGRGPRPHDFRHSFAVRTLIRWYQAGADVERHLPVLSTFLGHVLVRNTYWYLTEHPELMRLAVQRLDARWEGR